MPDGPSPIAVRLARGLATVFFQRIETLGLEHVPEAGPVLFVANHHNSLVDPTLLLAELPRKPRFLAKSTLWKVPITRRLLDLAGSIPVYRRQDVGEDTSRNRETFAACHEALAAGGAIALFPEGISHDAPHLAPLKTGAARIVLEAETERGPLGIRIIPVGLTFDQKATFRSRVLVHAGQPIDPSPWVKQFEKDPRGAARSLTEELRQRLGAVTLNYPSEGEVNLVERASEVIAVREKELPARLALAEAFAIRSAVLDVYARLHERYPEEVEAVRRRAAGYAAALQRHGLRDDHVASRYPRTGVLQYLLGSGSLLLFWLPFAALGTLLNWVPYRLCGLLASWTRTQDLPATYKLMAGLVFFPLTWLAEVALATRAFGADGGSATAFLAPASAWIALRFHERYERFFDEAAAWIRLRLRRGSAAELRTEREALRNDLRRLRDLDRDETA